MLQISYIRDNKDKVINGLKKRHFSEIELIEKSLDLDEKRRATQAELDQVLAQSNKLSKEIGVLKKEGKKEEAQKAKEKTVQYKELTKNLSTTLDEVTEQLTQILYRIPNVPNEIVPQGKSAEDNLTVFRSGEIPHLFEGALPHWELAKKYNIIDNHIIHYFFTISTSHG